MRTILLVIFTIFAITIQAQFTYLFDTDPLISESSGLIFVQNRVITHNDSGNEAALFEIDTLNGDILRKVIVQNATNVDWEDICADNDFIYIADIGNNQGNRTDLKIYKISIQEYFYVENDTVVAEEINISYADQVDFSPGNYTTNYDAEAIISYQDSLYIFTKNWSNQKTNLYPCSKIPGSYSLSQKTSIDVHGLITGATFNNLSGEIILTGYSITSAFIIEIQEQDFLSSSISFVKYSLSISAGTSFQIEAITHTGQNMYLATSETGISGSGALFVYHTISEIGILESDKNQTIIFPNPTDHLLQVVSHTFLSADIYDSTGRFIKSFNHPVMDVSGLRNGLYTLKINHINNGNSEALMFIIK